MKLSMIAAMIAGMFGKKIAINKVQQNSNPMRGNSNKGAFTKGKKKASLKSRSNRRKK